MKGETPAGDRIWLTSPDGTSTQAVARVMRDLSHLVVESAFGIDDGLWGALATRRHGPLRLVTDASSASSSYPERGRAGYVVARAATSAVVNLWRHGPDTPGGVRDRLRAAAQRETWVAARIEDLAVRVDDDTIRATRIAVRRLHRSWRGLPPGGTLGLAWPLLA